MTTEEQKRYVFVVRNHAYDDQEIWGIFDTLDLALACYRKALGESRWSETVGIERFTVNVVDDDDSPAWVYPPG